MAMLLINWMKNTEMNLKYKLFQTAYPVLRPCLCYWEKPGNRITMWYFCKKMFYEVERKKK